MNVWIVTSFNYGEYQVKGVFDSYKKAEQYVDKSPDLEIVKWKINDYEIKEKE